VDAIALAEHALGVPQLILAMPPSVPEDFEAVLEPLVRRREAREPLQHIIGRATFRYLSLLVAPGVFLPRPETEVVAQQAVDEARRLIAVGVQPLVVDLCTGSGVIALSVAVEVPGSRVVAIDIDLAAVTLTRVNAAALLDDADSDTAVPAAVEGRPVPAPRLLEAAAPDTAVPAAVVPHAAVIHAVVPTAAGPAAGPGRPRVDSDGLRTVRVELGDVSDPGLLAELNDTVDILISNPPYIPDDAVPLEREVADHDPPVALFGGGADGLDLPRYVVAAAVRLLAPGGLFVMEHADVQGATVRELVDRTDAFSPAVTHHDLTGRERFVTARLRTT
ncbi:MAG: peptide chain release factor N(5)-glutamine methyltransferase, partial [Actinomycetota bacterium]|nr:peptide chain release factor N(5)-glutamine methyltransferase [Actinomycetota bacterium]